ncbi:MAG: ORF6N domain-containing protein, partial [Bacteroidales bacterium]|nr:ORF6N domain-containing protein [Bacteroidales bacterium]
MTDKVSIKKESNIEIIKNRIYEVRGQRVMLDRDLAELYNVETRALNQAVKRNIDRFPEDFMFVMTDDEMNAWKSQIVMSNSIRMGMRRPPVVFTELGIAMLSSVLRSETAIQVNINIMRTFVAIRHAIGAWQGVNLKVEQLSHKVDNLNARVDENNLGAEHIAELLGQPIEQVFKTLVLRGDKTGLFVCVIPGAEE